jgi:hypothetical protein
MTISPAMNSKQTRNMPVSILATSLTTGLPSKDSTRQTFNLCKLVLDGIVTGCVSDPSSPLCWLLTATVCDTLRMVRDDLDLICILLKSHTGRNSNKLWGNTEVREYTFESEDDEDAKLVPVRKVVQEGADNPTSSSKQFTY